MHQINEYREEEVMPEIGLTTIHRIIKSPWEKARLRWTTQVLVRFGEHEFDCAANENQHLALTNTPAFFDRAKMPPLSVNQFFYFYECHKKI
jgi:hypothetical protein